MSLLSGLREVSGRLLRALRCVVGNIGLLVCFEGIAALTPKRPLALYSTLRFVKYAIVPVYILQLAPCAFEHVGI